MSPEAALQILLFCELGFSQSIHGKTTRFSSGIQVYWSKKFSAVSSFGKIFDDGVHPVGVCAHVLEEKPGTSIFFIPKRHSQLTSKR